MSAFLSLIGAASVAHDARGTEDKRRRNTARRLLLEQ
jgi:hypothetical protein